MTKDKLWTSSHRPRTWRATHLFGVVNYAWFKVPLYLCNSLRLNEIRAQARSQKEAFKEILQLWKQTVTKHVLIVVLGKKTCPHYNHLEDMNFSCSLSNNHRHERQGKRLGSLHIIVLQFHHQHFVSIFNCPYERIHIDNFSAWLFGFFF